MSINSTTTDQWVRYLHLYPKTGDVLESKLNHYVIPYGEEMCVELKQGKKGIKAKVETLTAQELEIHDQQEYSLPTVIADIFWKMASAYNELRRHKTALKNFTTVSEPKSESHITGYEIHRAHEKSTVKGIETVSVVSFYVDTEGSTLPPLCIERHRIIRANGDLIEKVKVLLVVKGLASDLNSMDILKSNVKEISADMATCAHAVLVLRDKIATLRAEIPEGIEFFPNAPDIDDDMSS